MCEALEISRSGYYKGQDEQVGVRMQRDGELRSHIVRMHRDPPLSVKRILRGEVGSGWSRGQGRVSRGDHLRWWDTLEVEVFDKKITIVDSSIALMFTGTVFLYSLWQYKVLTHEDVRALFASSR